MKNKLLKAIIFDMDGVLIESEYYYRKAQEKISALYNKKYDHSIEAQMTGRKPIEAIKIFMDRFDIVDEPEKVLALRQDIVKRGFRKSLNTMPGVFDFINNFYNDFILAIGTGSSREMVDIVMHKLELSRFMECIVCSDDVERGKPDPDIYLEVCRRLGVLPSEAIVIEDSSNGVVAASKAGCFVIAIPNSETRNQCFESADVILDSLYDARDYILSKRSSW